MKLLACILTLILLSPAALAVVVPVHTITPSVSGTLKDFAETPMPKITEEPQGIIDSGSDIETIRYVQQMLAGIGAISEDQVTGVYDTNTAVAASNFQRWANENQCNGKLSVTGFIDVATRIELEYAYEHNVIMPTPEPSPTPTPPPILDFDAVNRNPDKYKDQFFTISGEVVQIVEEPFEDEGGAYSDTTLVRARIATKGHYDDMIYVFYYRSPGEDRILEGDKITFEGVGFGLYTYESVEHISITLPLFLLTKVIEIK